MENDHGAYLKAELVRQLGRYPVHAAVADGKLLRLWNSVLVDAARALEVPTRAAAALLLHHPPAAIANLTAAYLHGCTAASSGAVHVMVPYGSASRTRPGLTVHNGSMSDDDVTELAGLRVLSSSRVIADVLCTARERDALAVTDQMLASIPEERREHFRSQVAHRLAFRPDPRGTRRGARLLALATGRADSPPESWLRYEVVKLGCPPPEANWPVTAPDGTPVYWLDLAWPDALIALEYNGYAVHLGREKQDLARIEDLRRRGWIVIVVTKDDFVDDTRLRYELRRAFTARGYSYFDD